MSKDPIQNFSNEYSGHLLWGRKESKDIKGGIRGRNSRTARQYNNKKRVKISKVESEAVIQGWADNTITKRE